MPNPRPRLPNEQTASEDNRGKADIQGSNYDIIRKRLLDQGSALRGKADELNERRQDKFGSVEMTIVGQDRIRTENSCIPTDIVNVGGSMLFGYNVKIGLKRKTSVDDVFSLHAFEKTEDGFKLEHVPQDSEDNFLSETSFVTHFDELFTYYDDARLRQLRKLETTAVGDLPDRDHPRR